MLFNRDKKTKDERLAAKDGSAAAEVMAESGETDLTKLKKKELLEILLRQGEEIDRLRAEIDSLKAALEDKDLKLSRAGSIAEASLAVTGIFEEAQKAATLYLRNVKRLVDERAKAEMAAAIGSADGADRDE